MNALPMVSIIMPVFNEERFIEHTLGAVLEQEYPPERFEVIVADGRSTDRTREMIEVFAQQHPNVRLVDNPGRIVSTGLNRAIEQARGEIIVRLDGHCEYPRDYVRTVVRLREETGADSAGGVLVPLGQTNYTSHAVAAAYYSPVGIGGALKGHSDAEKLDEVDTVHGGCWRRERLLAVGGFDEEMVRNQDDELSFRLRKTAGKIVRSSAVRVKYWVRDSYRKLFMQFAQYGYWKVRVVQKHPAQSNIRHLVPALFVLAVVVSGGLAPFFKLALAAWLVCVLGYAAAVTLAALREALRSELRLWPGIAVAIPAMHIGYGVGFLLGWLRWAVGPLPTDRVFERVTR